MIYFCYVENSPTRFVIFHPVTSMICCPNDNPENMKIIKLVFVIANETKMGKYFINDFLNISQNKCYTCEYFPPIYYNIIHISCEKIFT